MEQLVWKCKCVQDMQDTLDSWNQIAHTDIQFNSIQLVQLVWTWLSTRWALNLKWQFNCRNWERTEREREWAVAHMTNWIIESTMIESYHASWSFHLFFLFISFFIRWRINYWNQNINKCGNESTCIEWIWRLYTVYIRRPFYKCYNAISSIIIVFVKTLLNYFYPFSELLWVHSKNDSDRRTCGTCRHFAGVTLLPHWPIASFIHGLMRSMQWKTFTDHFSDDRNKCGGLLSLIMEQ